MDARTALLGLLLSGFFAIACLRAAAPGMVESGPSPMGLFRFPGRLERLRRARWQWFAMVSLMVVLRLQRQLPPVLEAMAAFQFLLFLALPASVSARGGSQPVQHR